MRELTPDSTRVGELTSEDDLRSRLEAVSDVLRALSRSAMRLQPILEQIVEAAARLGRADSCLVWLVDSGLLRLLREPRQPAGVRGVPALARTHG